MAHDLNEVGASSLRSRLRRETAIPHQALEARLDVLDPGLSLERLRRILEIFYGFYEPVEAGLARLAATWPTLGVPLRARTDLLARDLVALDLPPEALADLPRCADLPRSTRHEHLLGCLYVLEGACLGGQVIAPILRERLPVTEDRGLSYFVGDGSGTGPRWRFVIRRLDELTREGALAEDEIVASAHETFCSFGRWVDLRGVSR